MDFGINEALDEAITPVDTSWTTIIITVLILLLVQQITHRVIGRVVERAIRDQKYSSAKERKKRRDTLVAIFNSFTTVLVIVIGIIVILSQFGVNIGALIAGFGALGVIIGIAGQDLIKDFLKGPIR